MFTKKGKDSMDYQEASQYWVEKEKGDVHLAREELLKKIDQFISGHNTMALATGYDTFVRCTPVEYNYYDGFFYIFAEVGKKFIGLEKNPHVSFSVFEPYLAFTRFRRWEKQRCWNLLRRNMPKSADIRRFLLMRLGRWDGSWRF